MAKLDLKGLIAGVAPTLATMLGGPLAGMAVKALSAKVLDKPDGTEEEITNALAVASPDALLELRKVDAELKSKLIDAGVRLEELDTQDRASARALATAKGIGPQVVLTCVYTIGYFVILIALMAGWTKVPTELRDVFISLITLLTGILIQQGNFWFGSSHGSQRKDELKKLAGD